MLAGLGPNFANSFVILATKGEPTPSLWPETQIGVYYQPSRHVRYVVETRIAWETAGLTFRRTKLAPQPPPPPLQHTVSDSTYIAGRDFLDLLTQADDATMDRLLRGWASLLEHNEDSNIDLLPHNLMVTVGDALIPIDLEWKHPGYTALDILHRGIFILALQLAERCPPERWGCERVEDLARHLGERLQVASGNNWLDELLRNEAKLQAEIGLFVTDEARPVEEAMYDHLWGQLRRPLSDMPLGCRDHDQLALSDRRATQLADQLANLDARLEGAEAAAAMHAAALSSVTGSRSWRMTAPLRAISRARTRLRPRGRTRS